MTAFTAGILSLNEKKVIIEGRQSFLKCGNKKNKKKNRANHSSPDEFYINHKP